MATSQPLVDRGVTIFSIGARVAGAQEYLKVNEDELEKIARSKERVRIIDGVENLATDKFVKGVAEKTCQFVRKEIKNIYVLTLM